MDVPLESIYLKSTFDNYNVLFFFENCYNVHINISERKDHGRKAYKTFVRYF
jgi:hypothetical protein